ncbi:MAG: hypothetical protein ABSB11_04235 [Sedimentisphaerales bacterium]|jgi:hypothetical protein
MADQIMAESKTRKPGLLRRIFWWLWVILLTALLALGFVFSAPWKVITLIATFLAAATILPRIYRKWFWLAVGLVVLSLIVWIFLPDDNKGWKPYQFDKELAQFQARYAVPDSENAAIIYNQILTDWKQKEANEPNLPRDWFSLVKYGPWLSKDQPEVAVHIKYYQDTIDQLAQTVPFKRCTFPIPANIIVYGEQLDRYSAMRKWAYLLIAAGNNNIAEGNVNEAIEKYFTVIRLGQHECQQPTPIDMLVGIAIEALAMSRINDFVVCGDTNEFYLAKLEQGVSEIKHDWNSDLTGFIDSDKIFLKNLWGLMCYQINAQGKIRFSHDPTETIREQSKKVLGDASPDTNYIFSGYWWKKLMKACSIPYWFYMPATPEKLGEIIDKSFEKHYLMTKPDFDWHKESKIPPEFHYKINLQQLAELMAQINKSVYLGLHDNYLDIAAQQKGTLLIIAMKRYKNTNGYWPEKLEDIKYLVPAEMFVDPINGDSFVYKRTEENFTLYSKGKNGIDDGGKGYSNAKDKGEPDDLLIWPHKSKVSRQQEQKTEN